MILRAFLLLYMLIPQLSAQSLLSTVPDVLHYEVKLMPDIEEKSIEGVVSIRFQMAENASEVIFNCGVLLVDEVEGASVASFRQEAQQLIIEMTTEAKSEQEVKISYHGKPRRGLVFSPEVRQAYTVYFTSEWMVCHDQIQDRASININIITPTGLSSIASGTLIGKEQVDEGKVMHSWKQEAATPAYTFGFAIGQFHEVVENHGGTSLHYYSSKHDTDEMAKIFQPSADMLTFFEEKAGVPYFQESYSQVLIGNHYQEISGFAVLKESYGRTILQDSTEVNLIAHEMAHQWWGNMITCKNLGHFWLNEAFATYMSAAFNEHRFGREKYMENINAYEEVYLKVKAKGADKPLVFKSWANPTADDRSLVYFKGAYVLHLLREALGDEMFWEGIRSYSRKYYGKPVLTQDFQQAMETSSGKNLSKFFNTWIY